MGGSCTRRRGRAVIRNLRATAGTSTASLPTRRIVLGILVIGTATGAVENPTPTMAPVVTAATGAGGGRAGGAGRGGAIEAARKHLDPLTTAGVTMVTLTALPKEQRTARTSPVDLRHRCLPFHPRTTSPIHQRKTPVCTLFLYPIE